MLLHAILALLRDGSDHGYRLRQRLDRLFEPVWQVNVGQVYQVLERLRRARWVEELPPETDMGGGHERWPVAITPEGRSELERWLTDAIRPSRPPGPVRNEILGRIAIGGSDCTAEVLDGIVAERVVYAREFEQIVARCREFDGARAGVDAAKRLALEASRLSVRAHIEWLDACLSLLTANGSAVRAQSSSWAPSSTTRLGGIPK